MATHPLQAVVRHLRRMARPSDVAPSSDAELLTRFAGRHDESAFAEIVQRHGPLVWAVCRNGLLTADADDAFQATFLILTKQATRIRKPAALAGWLVGVARRVVRRVRIKEARRTEAEQRLAARPRPVDDSDGLVQSEWRQLLNEELHRLPEKYLLPMLLCYYQGLTNEETARRLGVPHGTVCGRLSRARELLRRRLIRRGVTLTVGALTAGAAAPPAEVLAATLATCGSVTNAGANLTAPALQLAEAVMNSILVEKVRVWTIGLMVVTAVGGGIGGYSIIPATGSVEAQTVAVAHAAEPPPKAEPPGKIEEVELAGKAVMNGQMDDAYRLLQQAAKKHPEIPPARLMLARLYQAANLQTYDAKRFHAIMDQAVVENPDHPVVYLQLGGIARSEGRNAEAILDGQKALELASAPRWTAEQKKDINMGAWSMFASVHEARGDWAAMREQLVKLLNESPKDGRLRQRLARALIGLGKLDDAFREMTRATQDTPALGSPAVGMATLFAEAKDEKKAREWFDKAVQEQPDSFQAHLAYAQWLVQQNDWANAKLRVEQAAKLRPGSIEVSRLQKLIVDGEKPDKAPNPP